MTTTTTNTTAQNYTPAQTLEIVDLYQAGNTVELLAEQFGRSTRSIIAKLSREGVYVAKAKTKGHKVTKLDMINLIAVKLEVDPDVLASLEKAQVAALEALVAKIA